MDPDPPLSAAEVKSNNQLAAGMPKAGGGCQESVNDHTAMTVTNDESLRTMMRATMKIARAARAMVTTKRVPGNREGKGGKGHGIGDEGGVQQRGQWRQQRGRWR